MCVPYKNVAELLLLATPPVCFCPPAREQKAVGRASLALYHPSSSSLGGACAPWGGARLASPDDAGATGVCGAAAAARAARALRSRSAAWVRGRREGGMHAHTRWLDPRKETRGLGWVTRRMQCSVVHVPVAPRGGASASP